MDSKIVKTTRRPVNLDRDLLERFERVYPRLARPFCDRAITLALQDKKFFEEVFFNALFIEQGYN